MYYNPESENTCTYQELCAMYNASIPFSKLAYNGWYKLADGTVPNANEYQKVEEDGVELIGDRYTTKYKLTNIDIEEYRQMKLDQLTKLFDYADNNAYLISSLGFTADANGTANRNVAGLVTSMELTNAETVQFCAYDNSFVELTLEQVRTLQLEIIQQAQFLYAQKWQIRTALLAAETVEAISEVEFKLYYKNFGDGSNIEIDV